MRAQGLFCSSFRKIAVLYLRLFISVFFLVCQRGSEKKERKGGHGVRHFYSELLRPLPIIIIFFFWTGFERKYLTEGAFVCFQMIDFGIWATPLAVQG